MGSGVISGVVFAVVLTIAARAPGQADSATDNTHHESLRARRNYEDFQKLGRHEIESLRQLKSDIDASADRAELESVLRRYHDWADDLGPAARAHLRRTPAAQRLAKVEVLRRWQPSLSSQTPTAEEQTLVDWLVEHRLSNEERQKVWGAAFPQRCQALVQAARRLGWLYNRPGQPYAGPKLEPEELSSLMPLLGAATQQALDPLTEAQRCAYLGWKLRLLAVRHAPPTIPADTDEPDIARFFRDEVAANPPALDFLLKLPPGAFREKLAQLHHDARSK